MGYARHRLLLVHPRGRARRSIPLGSSRLLRSRRRVRALAVVIYHNSTDSFDPSSTSLVLLFSLSFRLSTILPRLTLLAIFLPICLLLAFLPRTTHSLSVFSGLTGAFLLVLGVDLFVHLGFVDALGLLVAPSGVSVKGKATEMVVQWGTGGGKGLIAGWWLLAIISSAWQWWWGGENGEVDEVRHAPRLQRDSC